MFLLALVVVVCGAVPSSTKTLACDGSCKTWFDGCNDCACGPKAGEVGACSFNPACSLDRSLSTSPRCKQLKAAFSRPKIPSPGAHSGDSQDIDKQEEPVATIDGPPTSSVSALRAPSIH